MRLCLYQSRLRACVSQAFLPDGRFEIPTYHVVVSVLLSCLVRKIFHFGQQRILSREASKMMSLDEGVNFLTPELFVCISHLSLSRLIACSRSCIASCGSKLSFLDDPADDRWLFVPCASAVYVLFWLELSPPACRSSLAYALPAVRPALAPNQVIAQERSRIMLSNSVFSPDLDS